jgi:hypothetical protein
MGLHQSFHSLMYDTLNTICTQIVLMIGEEEKFYVSLIFFYTRNIC